MDVQAVIFDFDGVINDSFREGLRRIKIICAIHDIPFRREHHKRLTELWGMPGAELLRLGLGIGEKLAHEVLYPAWERLDLRQAVPLIPRAREVLYWLRRNNITATLLTSRNRDNLMSILDQLDILRDFSIVSTRTDALYSKPDPRVFRYILEKLQEELHIGKVNCIFIGDTPADINAGQVAKIKTLLVQTGPYLLKHASKLLLPLANVLNSIDDLPGWIEEHHKGELTSYD